MRWAITPLPPYLFMTLCIINHMDNFTSESIENRMFESYSNQVQLDYFYVSDHDLFF
jgi:hypothetical protein